MTIFGSVVMDMISKTFFYPTFTNHLGTKFGLTVEESSAFFVINMASYFLMIQFLNKFTSNFGLKMTIVLGLFCGFIGVLMIGPIAIFPQ